MRMFSFLFAGPLQYSLSLRPLLVTPKKEVRLEKSRLKTLRGLYLN